MLASLVLALARDTSSSNISVVPRPATTREARRDVKRRLRNAGGPAQHPDADIVRPRGSAGPPTAVASTMSDLSARAAPVTAREARQLAPRLPVGTVLRAPAGPGRDQAGAQGSGALVGVLELPGASALMPLPPVPLVPPAPVLDGDASGIDAGPPAPGAGRQSVAPATTAGGTVITTVPLAPAHTPQQSICLRSRDASALGAGGLGAPEYTVKTVSVSHVAARLRAAARGVAAALHLRPAAATDAERVLAPSSGICCATSCFQAMTGTQPDAPPLRTAGPSGLQVAAGVEPLRLAVPSTATAVFLNANVLVHDPKALGESIIASQRRAAREALGPPLDLEPEAPPPRRRLGGVLGAGRSTRTGATAAATGTAVTVVAGDTAAAATLPAATRYGLLVAAAADYLTPTGPAEGLARLQNALGDAARELRRLKRQFDWSNDDVSSAVTLLVVLSALLHLLVPPRFIVASGALGVLLYRTRFLQVMSDLGTGMLSYAFASLANGYRAAHITRRWASPATTRSAVLAQYDVISDVVLDAVMLAQPGVSAMRQCPPEPGRG
jgi:hypothetical protein